MPTPHPATTCVIKLSGSLIGATGAACTEVVTTKASAAKAINLIIRASHVFKKEIFLTRG
jgi:anti-anti-sigma regulatory factor